MAVIADQSAQAPEPDGPHSDPPHAGATKAGAVRAQPIVRSDAGDLARRLLFEPVADWLARCAKNALPGCDDLNRWAGERFADSRIAARGGVRFVVPDGSPLRYEERIHACREIVTRGDNWHDFFNALVWLRFPLAKTALNDAHLRNMRHDRSSNGRGPVRDALTQFDESGVIAASSDERLIDLLIHRRWKELFWTRRRAVAADMRFIVFGHGLYDALRAPFYRICGRAALLTVDRAAIERGTEALCVEIDARLAARFEADYYPRPRALLALPLLGIPGVTAENASSAYYDDREQFRPPPDWS